MQVTHKESKSVMAYQLPTEIQHMIWTYSMYNSAKGLGFRKQIQEGWFKLRLRRLLNALETKSQDISPRTRPTTSKHGRITKSSWRDVLKISYGDAQDTLLQISKY